jgi:hypothetical protein
LLKGALVLQLGILKLWMPLRLLVTVVLFQLLFRVAAFQVLLLLLLLLLAKVLLLGPLLLILLYPLFLKLLLLLEILFMFLLMPKGWYILNWQDLLLG